MVSFGFASPVLTVFCYSQSPASSPDFCLISSLPFCHATLLLPRVELTCNLSPPSYSLSRRERSTLERDRSIFSIKTASRFGKFYLNDQYCQNNTSGQAKHCVNSQNHRVHHSEDPHSGLPKVRTVTVLFCWTFTSGGGTAL